VSGTRIMPLGDGTTEGYNSDALVGYRAFLERLLVNAGAAFDYVGGSTGGPTNLRDKSHEGHEGEYVAFFADEVAGYLTATPCDVMLAWVGTEQIAYETDPDAADVAADLIDFLDAVTGHASAPARILLALLPPIGTGDYDVNADVIDDFNELLPDIVADYPTVELVDLNTGFDADTLTDDGVHPTPAGFSWIAEKLFAALRLSGPFRPRVGHANRRSTATSLRRRRRGV
jgi:hypothetical protein